MINRCSTRSARRFAAAEALALTASLLLLFVGCGAGASPPPRPDETLRPSQPPKLASADSAPLIHTRIIAPPSDAPPGQVERPVFAPWYHPFLAGEEPSASVSVGTTSDGYLVGGVALPQPSRHHQVLPKQFDRDLGYGSRVLITTIVDAAAAVAREVPGSVTYIGNIGRRDGGDIPWSVSHNTGLDADLAFHSTNPLGWQTRPPMLLHFLPDGRSQEHHGFYRFDVPRNAALARALFEHPSSQVQYLFIARPLKAMLIAHWRRQRLDAALLSQLSEALRQPGDSAPHDDHLHLRVACPAQDICGGCAQTGRARDWIPDAEPRRLACIDEMTRRLGRERDDEQRARLIERLVLLDARDAASRLILKRLDDDAPRVRLAAAHALAALSDRAASATAALIKRAARESDPDVRCAILQALGQLGGAKGAAHVKEALADTEGRCRRVLPRHPSPLTPPPDPSSDAVPFALVAIEVAADIEDRAPVIALIERLSDPDPTLRAAAARALRRLTNHDATPGVDWSGLDDAARSRARDTWRAWYTSHGARTRDEWLIAGFQAHGAPVEALSRENIPVIAEAIEASPHISYNAQRALMRLTDHYPPSLLWSAADAQWYWRRYIRRNRRKLKLR